MRWLLALVVAFTLLGSSAAEAGLSDAEKSRNAAEKVAPPFGSIARGKWKALCMCKETGRLGALEILISGGDLFPLCTVPDFDSAGDLTFFVGCEDWIPFVK